MEILRSTAIPRSSSVEQQPSETLDGLRQMAREAQREGAWAYARSAYEDILVRQPEDAQALHGLGVAAYQAGDHAAALAALRSAATALPLSADIASDLAEVLRLNGHPEEAETEARRALTLQPCYPEAMLNLGVAVFQLQRPAEAERVARDILLLRQDWVPALLLLADAFREQNRPSEAERLYRRIRTLIPGHATATSNLGWMLIQQGRMEEGLTLCQASAQGSTMDVGVIENLVQAQIEFGNLDDAMQLLEHALARWPDSARLFMLLGMAWGELGDAAESAEWLVHAINLAPALTESKVRLAALLVEHDQLEQARSMLDDVLQAHPHRADAYLVRAKGRLAQGDVEGAVSDHRAAIAAAPGSAHAHAALGNTLASAGDLNGALTAHRQALSINPQCVPACAGLLSTLRSQAGETAYRQAQSMLGAPWMTERRRAALHFGLAAYHDAQGEWSKAAQDMVAANALRLSAEVRRGRCYDPKGFENTVDQIIETFTPSLFEQLSGLGSDSERPVFVVGMPRSGTTLTEQIAASHPLIHGAGERSFASRGFASLPHTCGQPERSPFEVLKQVRPELLRLVAEQHLVRLAELDKGCALRVVDKMPDNYALLGWLAILFPKARFVHCRRNLRDVALSCWITNFASIPWANDLEHLAYRLVQYKRLMKHWAEVLPVRLHTVDYETLVASQREESMRLITALGLPWDERCMAFHQTERLVRTASVSQVREPMYSRSVGRWTHYSDMLAPLLEILE